MNLVLIGALSPRIYAGHLIYKGKAVIQVGPRAPEFMPLNVLQHFQIC